jgi:hypothetical protein
MNNQSLLRKIISFILVTIVFFIAFGIAVRYYLESKPVTYDNKICYKNKLLTKWEEESSIYTRMKGVRCEVDGDILIVEELN